MIARLALAGLLVLAPLADAAAASKRAKRPGHATSSFDGLWSVLIITEKGSCDRGYRYAVRIKGGRVGHADPSSSSFRISGSVGGGGATRVNVARGTQSASGTGRLTRTGGSGRWQSARGECSGVWQAERRGG
ncbi:MAG: hypothetical protein AB7V13_18660 [Pseudorhodoplanes sp.]|uniref:hypothetical protein n=1 Tax=Pseudorhodoplanes sp. TaxID=1934341 RepID=UPI003D13295B